MCCITSSITETEVVGIVETHQKKKTFEKLCSYIPDHIVPLKPFSNLSGCSWMNSSGILEAWWFTKWPTAFFQKSVRCDASALKGEKTWKFWARFFVEGIKILKGKQTWVCHVFFGGEREGVGWIFSVLKPNPPQKWHVATGSCLRLNIGMGGIYPTSLTSPSLEVDCRVVVSKRAALEVTIYTMV